MPQYQILAGGCLVKSAEAKDLGNVADAYVNEWSTSIENVLKRYGNINSVVPGHGEVGDKGLLLHTLDLLNKKKERKKGEIIFSSFFLLLTIFKC